MSRSGYYLFLWILRWIAPGAVGLLLLSGLLSGCAEPAQFERLSSRTTGVSFSNDIIEDDSVFNPITFDYIYNGGGVAIADLNNDGLPDLFFTGNRVSNRLYLNRGDFKFEDVTPSSGLATRDLWSSGIAIADINADGWLDIYVSVGGNTPDAERANRLYINEGTDNEGGLRFTECAGTFGVADERFSTQAAFFDYDRDGDLDLYVLNNSIESFNKNQYRPKLEQGESASTDRLYRNDGLAPGMQASTGSKRTYRFTDVSDEAGIRIEGYGLGLVISDLNQDGWPDVYAANDFLSNDLAYINNQNGTFTNKIGAMITAQTHNGMGVDVADYSNDGRPDIVVLDMLPPDNYRQKMMLPGQSIGQAQLAQQFAYQPQYVRNTLQLNLGPNNTGTPQFLELGRLAGIAATDWSWAPLFADLDNDGWKDLLITNGYRRDVTNLDFIESSRQTVMMGTRDANRMQLFAMLDTLPEVKLPNVVYRNNGDLTFSDQTRSWGLDEPVFSNGAAYGDLDQDGDLDLVLNNLNAAAGIYKNNLPPDGKQQFLRVRLQGPTMNTLGYGARVTLFVGALQLYQELNPVRGYLSMVEPVLHFGLGNTTTSNNIDSLHIRWPDARITTLYDVPANQTLTVNHARQSVTTPVRNMLRGQQQTLLPDAVPGDSTQSSSPTALPFPPLHLPFPADVLPPRPFSRPADFDGDGTMDVLHITYEQAAQGIYTSHLHLQKTETDTPISIGLSGGDDNPEKPVLVTDVHWTDFNGDEALDLIVASLWSPLRFFEQREGAFVDVSRTLLATNPPGLWTRLASGDFDGDGDTDYIAGNWGHNATLTASESHPLQMYVADFDQNGVADPIVSQYTAGEAHVIFSRDELISQIPGMRGRFPSYHKYAGASLQETLSAQELATAVKFEAHTLETLYLEAGENGLFIPRALPPIAQAGTVHGLTVEDVNKDGLPDIIMELRQETNSTAYNIPARIVLFGGSGGLE